MHTIYFMNTYYRTKLGGSPFISCQI